MIRIQSPKAIIFDKDGTLIDVHHYWINMTELRIKFLTDKIDIKDQLPTNFNSILEKKLGINRKLNKINKNGPAGVVPKTEIMQVVKNVFKEINCPLSISDIETSFKQADEESSHNIKNYVKLLSGVKDFIESSKQKNIDLNLVSNDITKRSELALRSLGFISDFRFVLGQDAVNKPKPNPDLAELILKKGEYNADDIVNIGDHPNDIKMGLKAGITRNIALLTGLSSREDFENMDCLILNSLAEIRID